MNARERLLLPDLSALEREDLEAAARGCDGDQPDPWNGALVWKGCPGRLAFRHGDVGDALTVKGLAAMAALSDWPQGYAARIVETWTTIEGERVALREAG